MTDAEITAHIGLVHLCAGRLRARGIPYEELCSAGNLGLCKAARGFDPARGCAFATYAVPVILGEMRRLFRDGGGVRISRGMQERAAHAKKAAESLRQKHHREPTVGEIAAVTGESESDTAEALCAAQPLVPMDAEESRCAEIPVPSPEQAITEHLALRQALGLLAPADRDLIALRYEYGMTQSAAAERLHMTQVQVSRRERKILQFLRTELS
ncbi:MAG: sigma-70 family RNA polymerase sigma factor [Oscillospiraceae bacterium]|nr:sigma-70 family RNA polymerase sigma factor [Oscillospiraceae bacterium]